MAKKPAPTILDVLTDNGDVIQKRKHNLKLDGHGVKIEDSVQRDTSGRDQGVKGKVSFISGPCVNDACPGLVLVKEEALASALTRIALL
jgi:hypothetical protein